MKKSIVFCDIYGTFLDNTPDEVEKFCNYLLNLDENDELYFSFITTDRIDIVEYCMGLLREHFLGTKIKFGNQFIENQKLTNGKIFPTPMGKISQIISELDMNKYDNVYYFDDIHMNVMLFDNLKKKYPDISFCSVYHSEHSKNLSGVNKALSEMFQVKRKKRV